MIKHSSLATKLILFFSSICSLILLGTFVINYHFSKKMIMETVNGNANNLTGRKVNQINAVTLSVEKITEIMAHFFENDSMEKERIREILCTVTIENEDIFGSAVFFEEPFVSDKGPIYDQYCYEKDGELIFVDTSETRTKYFLKDYYQIPKELNKPVWSEPYVDDDANITMVTYSVPFYDSSLGKKGKFKGIVTTDISLEGLTKIVNDIKVLKSGDAFLLSNNGTVIAHPQPELRMNETIFSCAEERGDDELRMVGREMIKGESGFVRFKSLGRHLDSWMCFAPVPSTGWSLGVIFPEREFMEDVTKLNQIIAALCAAGMALLIVVIVVIARSITRPLQSMALAAEAIGGGNLEAKLPATVADDEVGKLAKAFGYMQISLKKYIADLKETTAAKERIESELQIAREIQSSMLPRIFPPFPTRKEFELFAIMEPAKEVGGDFYDFFLIAKNKLFFIIGDVSGKGVPAALFMMIAKILMKNEALQELPPNEVLYRVNNIMALDNDSAMFATIFCGVLDTDTGEIEFSNAGHNPPVLCRKGRPNEFLQIDHGFVLGPMPGTKFTLQKLRLAPDDTLFMYTDGVTEAMNPKKQLFSEERLQKVLADVQDMDTATIIEALHDDIRLFANGEPQSDDITMLALNFKGDSL